SGGFQENCIFCSLSILMEPPRPGDCIGRKLRTKFSRYASALSPLLFANKPRDKIALDFENHSARLSVPLPCAIKLVSRSTCSSPPRTPIIHMTFPHGFMLEFFNIAVTSIKGSGDLGSARIDAYGIVSMLS